MRMVCQQTILTKYHALFVICYFWKSDKIWNCHLLQIIGGALWVKKKFTIDQDLLESEKLLLYSYRYQMIKTWE